MTAADRVQEAPPRPGHGAPGRHSAFAGAAERRPAARRPTVWIVAPSVCSAVLAAAAIVIVVNGAGSAGYHLKSGTMIAVWVLGGLIAAVVVATLAFAGRPGPAAEIPAYPEPERRLAPPAAMPQPVQVPRPAPAPAPAPLPQRTPPAAAMPPQVAANATEAAATLAAAVKGPAHPAPVSDEGVDLQVIFAQLVRRLLTLVLQQINRLDELENEVEDPKLLKSLFGIDHQATQVRRYGENIGVLVGALPQRQWTHPVPVTVAQRSAVSETPDYPRVQVIPRAPGRIHGHAVSDVIHILSELVENATNYSNPTTKVTVGAHRVSAGLAIEINDHGIGMESDQFRRLNTLLRDPSGANVRDLLSQGRIGLSVVAKMAQRHGIAVELAPNVTGGTMALVVIPDALLAPEELPAEKGRQPRRGIDTTQLPARPALVPLPDPLPPPAAATPAGSAASLSPVAASAPPLPSPATSHVPPLPTPPAYLESEYLDTGTPPSDGDQTLRVPPLPASPAAAAQESAPSVSVWPASDPLGYQQSDFARPAPAEPRWPSTTPPAAAGPTPVQAAPVPRPTGAVAYPPQAGDYPVPGGSGSYPSPAASGGVDSTGSLGDSGSHPSPATPGAGGTAATGSSPPPAPPAAGPRPAQSATASVPPWSQPSGAPSYQPRPAAPRAPQHTAPQTAPPTRPQPTPRSSAGEQTEPMPGLLPDGRPQLRRRTPQGHISARLLQAEGQAGEHSGGALSPTMMSDFWQGLSSGTAPADPPAAGPDPSQQDRTTANRQEWNQ